LDFKDYTITITITQNSNDSPEVSTTTSTTSTTTVPATKIVTSKQTNDLLKRADNLIKSMNTHISTTFEQNKQSVGGSNDSLIGDTDDSEFDIIKKLVETFEIFVDSYITHPTVLKLNSLSSNDIKSLFGDDDDNFNITSEQATFSVNKKDIKETIFLFLFYGFNFNELEIKDQKIQQEVNAFFEKILENYKKDIEKNHSNLNNLKIINIFNENLNYIHIKLLSDILRNVVFNLSEGIRSDEKRNMNIVNDVVNIIIHTIDKIYKKASEPINLKIRKNGNDDDGDVQINLFTIIDNIEKNNLF
jgi:hypothetical protein